MNVLVTNNDGKTINPVFEPTPTNLVQVTQFYKDLFANGEIAGYVINFDNGDVLAEGQVI